MRAGAVPSLALVVVEVSEYAPPVSDVSRARIKVFLVHESPDLSIIHHTLNMSCSSSPTSSSPVLISLSSSITLALLFG